MKSEIDEAQLTAYALNELDEAERPAVEALLAENPQAQRYVEEIQAAAGMIHDALKQQPVFGLSHQHHRRIESQFAHPLHRRDENPWWLFIRPMWALAASILIVLGTLAILLPRIYDHPDLIARPTTQDRPIIIPTIRIDEPPVVVIREPSELDTPAIATNLPDGQQPDNPFIDAAHSPTSSFPIETSAASYSNIKRYLQNNLLPPRDTVRVEELVNAFPYNYAAPQDATPFAAHIEIAQCPWNRDHRLVRIGLKARDLPPTATPAVIARDVKIKVEFNPSQAQKYRLIGYENRLAAKDAPANTVLAGHTVTALYEIIPTPTVSKESDLLKLTLDFKHPTNLPAQPIQLSARDPGTTLEAASEDFKFAAAVASFALTLRDPDQRTTPAPYALALDLARAGQGPDPQHLRGDFIDLLARAQSTLR